MTKLYLSRRFYFDCGKMCLLIRSRERRRREGECCVFVSPILLLLRVVLPSSIFPLHTLIAMAYKWAAPLCQGEGGRQKKLSRFVLTQTHTWHGMGDRRRWLLQKPTLTTRIVTHFRNRLTRGLAVRVCRRGRRGGAKQAKQARFLEPVFTIHFCARRVAKKTKGKGDPGATLQWRYNGVEMDDRQLKRKNQNWRQTHCGV